MRPVGPVLPSLSRRPNPGFTRGVPCPDRGGARHFVCPSRPPSAVSGEHLNNPPRCHRRLGSYRSWCGGPCLAPAEPVSSFLTLEPVNETVNVGDGDGERRMTVSPKWRRNRLMKMDAHSRGPIGPKREAIVGK